MSENAKDHWIYVEAGQLLDHPEIALRLKGLQEQAERHSIFNLPKSFLTKLKARYEGTRLGRQELNAEMLDDLPGALWTRAMFDAPDGSGQIGRVSWSSA